MHVNASACEVFPKKFCSHRWVENVPVVERALDVWPHIANYVKAVKSGKLPNPRIKSFDVIARCCDDPLFIVKANIGWDQECSAVARYDIVLNLPMSDTGAY